MAAKTITIDVEAYRRLKHAQMPNESFSQTIKRVVPRPFDLQAWMRRVTQAEFSRDFVDAVATRVASRGRRPRRRA